MKTSDRLYASFRRCWSIHRHHPWRARLHRLPRFRAVLLQRLGLERWVDVPLFNGRPMRALSGEIVSRAVISFGYSEPDLTALLCELVKPGMCVADIGTHFGYEAMLLADLVGPAGSVQAFEPNPAVAAVARHNLARWPHVALHSCALSSRPGQAAFDFPPLARSSFGGLATGGPGAGALVEVRMLDEIAFPARVDLIKCDAEGHEALILEGAPRVLAHRPVLILETGMESDSGHTPEFERVFALLAPLGYRALSFRFNGELEVAPAGRFPSGHASTLFLPAEHPRLPEFGRGWRRPVGSASNR